MSNSDSVPAQAGCAFGPFIVDYVRRLVWQDDRLLGLTGKSFEVLAYLIAHRDRVVPKEELLKEVWPGTFVQENNLVRQVSTLRKALGQKPEDHDYVLTVQGRGYRFVGDVTELVEIPFRLTASRHRGGVERSSNDARDVPKPPVEHVQVLAHTVSRPWGRAIAAATAAGLTLAAWTLWGTRTGGVDARVLRPVTYGPSGHLSPTWSDDGQALAFASDRDGNFDIFVQRLDQSDPTRITSSAAVDWQPAWSPDGKWIAFRSERDGGGIYLAPASGGPERRIASAGFEPRWSPDGRSILVTSTPHLRPRPEAFLIALDGGQPTPVLASITNRLQAPVFGWHPDGRVSVAGFRDGRWVFTTMSVGGSSPVESAESPEQAAARLALGLTLHRFVWAPDGRHVFFEGISHGARDLWRVEVDRDSLAWRGGFERLTTSQGTNRGMAVSRDGTRIAFEAAIERTRIWSFPILSGGALADEGRPVTPGAAGEFDAAVSRDGRQLAYRTVRDGRQELWQHSIADGRERRLLADPVAFRSSPRWSPDGSSLVYLVAGRTEGADDRPTATLAILSTTSGAERRLHQADAHEIVPDDWSADGRFVLGACRIPNAPQGICLVGVDNPGDVRVVASDAERPLHNARFAPNQQWISFTMPRPGLGRSTVFVRAVAGGPTIAITDGAAFEDKAHWAPDGRTLYFVSNRGGFLNVWGRRFDAATGTAEGPVFQVSRFDGLRRSFAADLRYVDMAITTDRMFLPVTEASGQIWILEGVDR